MRKNTLKNKTNWDWDLHTNFNYIRYIYEKPLCYQLFPETENQKHWENDIGVKVQKYTINKLKLDVHVEPGYSIAYTVSKVVYGLCVILLVWLFITFFDIKRLDYRYIRINYEK